MTENSINLGYKYKNINSGATLEIVGILGKDYIASCSICSSDTEMWPLGSIVVTKSMVLKNKSPCNCAEITHYSESQWLLRAKRKVKGSCYSIEGIIKGKDTKVTGQNKVKIKCNIHKSADIVQTLAALVQYGVCCKDCSLNNKKQDIGLIIKKFHPCVIRRFSVFEAVPRWESEDNTMDWVDCYCEVCAKDEYSRNNIGSGWFRGRIIQLKSNTLSCRCNKGRVQYTKQQREYQIKKRLNSIGGEFLYWEDEESKIKCISNFYYKCSAGHICKTSINRFINRQALCYDCNNKGKRKSVFDTEAPANLYVARFYNNEKSFVKVGITNRDIEARLNKQKSKSYNVFDYNILLHIYFDKGSNAWKAEREVKEFFEGGFVTRDEFRSGYTETFAPTQENDILNKINSVYKDLGGVIIFKNIDC